MALTKEEQDYVDYSALQNKRKQQAKEAVSKYTPEQLDKLRRLFTELFETDDGGEMNDEWEHYVYCYL
mgnify:CR=1 FL=1